MEILEPKKNLEGEVFSLEYFVPLPASRSFWDFFEKFSEKPQEIVKYLKEHFKGLFIDGAYDPLKLDFKFFKDNGRGLALERIESLREFFPANFPNVDYVDYYVCYLASIGHDITQDLVEDVVYNVSGEMLRLKEMFPQLDDVFLLRNLLRSRDLVGFDGVVSQLALFEDLKDNDPWFNSSSKSLLEAVAFVASIRDDFKIERFKYYSDNLSSIYMTVPRSYIYCALLYSSDPESALIDMVTSWQSAI